MIYILAFIIWSSLPSSNTNLSAYAEFQVVYGLCDTFSISYRVQLAGI